MTSEEKSSWVQGILALLTYSAYVVVILTLADGGPVYRVDYVAPMLWTIGISIAASILISVTLGILAPRDAGKKDQRDREIARLGDWAGHGLLVVGAVAALLLAMLEQPHFWIANAIYLGFTLSAIAASVAKIVAYRRGFHSW